MSHADAFPPSLLERFCRYVRIDTTAVEGAPGYPSSPGQLELGRLLVEELRGLGVPRVEQDEHGIVVAELPPTPGRQRAPVIAFLAHLDTSPETTGKNVKPIVHRNYPGGDITLPGNPSRVIRVAECPELEQMVGKTLVTTDGTTLLGGDDKAGVAVIMEAVAWLLAHPEVPRGPLRICFTCDEEIGRGVDHLSPARLGAVAAYTLDGSGVGEIDCETFSADLAVVTIRGVNIHPSIAKDRMVNAIRIAGEFVSRLPRTTLSPETTSDRLGFLHPYRIEGGVAEASIRILLRDFDTAKLVDYANFLHRLADTVLADFPRGQIDVRIEKQYRNMAEGLSKEPRAVAFAEEAMRRVGLQPRRASVRGGTDGSRLTEMGLPTPNLSCGQHNLHSPLEWVCVEEMEIARQVVVELVRLWATQ
ncbi:MAG: peptidase T [Gemmatales bacterium]|nr:peptidase T [Gemmatales bacterium]MDW8387044.1 peptidase T [Gemmatales bacterium]